MLRKLSGCFFHPGFPLSEVKEATEYMKGKSRVVIPFHSGKTLHPKIIKQVLDAIVEKE